MKHVKITIVGVIVFLHVLAPASAGAQIANGGFETGALTPGWSSTGDASVDNSLLGGSTPTKGTHQALLTTLTLSADFTPGLSFSDAVPVDLLEGFLGLASGSLSEYGAVEGSAILQVFNSNAGDTISFDWSFLTDEPTAPGDFAFVVIDQTISVLADASSPLIGGGSGFFVDGTGYQSLSRVLTTSGNHSIAFGVVDKGDNIGASGLLIDNVLLTPGQPPNRPPVTSDQSVTTSEDTSIAITLSATDPDGNPLIYIVVSGPSHGVLSSTPPNVIYWPNSNYFGPDSFTFKANDGQADSNIATVSITVTTVNDVPVANGQVVTTNKNTAVNITLAAMDVDGDSLTFIFMSLPAHGTLTGTPPNVVYTPALNYNGSDSFTFKANDGQTDSNIATVSITVNPVSPPAYTFHGFFSPVDNLPTVNNAKAGQAIPVKWRITDANRVPISDPASFNGLASYLIDCSSLSGNSSDAIEEYAAGSSGLQYSGDGYWQFNWKTPKTYASQCRKMVLTLGDGSTHEAEFKFR